MCCYQYPVADEKSEPCALGNYIPELPIDSEGFCIFHSRQWKWKKQHDFFSYLKKYKTESGKTSSKMDLRGVAFIAENSKRHIDYANLLTDTLLENSYFREPVKITGRNRKKKVIKGKLDFSSCHFEESVTFSSCLFKSGLSFFNNSFNQQKQDLTISMVNCQLEDSFEIRSQKLFTANLCIEDGHFMKEVFFTEITADGNEFEINRNKFYSYTSFSSCVIKNPFTDFSFNTFKGYAELSNVSFYGLTLFNSLTVEDRLLISGTEENKVFYGETEFDITPKLIKGLILFQQVQLTVLEQTQLDYLIHLEKVGYRNKKKVVIGTGCIKYRYQTPVKRLKTTRENSYIIEELTRSFTVFLSNTVQKNIGVEIVERTSKTISFFYFSDESFTTGVFEELFTEGQQTYFDIINSKNLVKYGDVSRKNQLNILQTKATQNAVFSKIVSQISEGEWRLSDSEAFCESLLLPNQKETFSKEFHKFLSKIDINKIIQAMIDSRGQIASPVIYFNFADKIVTIQEQNGPVNLH